MSADDETPPEDLRDRRYRGLRVLGRGSQATTFEATDVLEGKAVAIKRFRVRGASSWKDVELAEREATVLAELSHPLLPRYVEHFEDQGVLYLVTAKIEGESLAALRARGGRLDEAEVVRLLRDLAEVLTYLHGRAPPIVHRDVKPGNVVRTRDGRYALVDFGSVRDRLAPEGGSTVVGTFGFMAPEQFQGRAMPGSDVYGAAATAISMLTGLEPEKLPHRGLAIDVRAAVGKSVPEPLLHALERMLDPDPDRRARRVVVPLDPDETFRSSRGRKRDRRRKEREKDRDEERFGKKRRRAEKRRREQEEWRSRARVAGGLSRIVVSIALLLATIAVQLACRVVVPVVLVALAVVFGEPLRRAARKVAEAGVKATRSLERARAAAVSMRLPDEEDDLEAEADRAEGRSSGARVRVPEGDLDDDDASIDDERSAESLAEGEAMAEEEEARRRRSRSGRS